jgi:hypothetical protein
MPCARDGSLAARAKAGFLRMRWFFYAGIAGYALRLLLILVSDG